MQPPRNLRCFVRAKALTSAVYRVTASFPVTERFGLTSQMRRAAVSISANIAEGCGRNGNRALVAFLHIALGSASELACLLDVAVDLEYLGSRDAAPVQAEPQQTSEMLSRLIVRLRSRPDVPSAK